MNKSSAMCLCFFLVWPAAVSGVLIGCGTVEFSRSATPPPPIRGGLDGSVGYVVDGLHVTGRPVSVDISTYRLIVSGNVRNELSLSFDEVRAMPAVREEANLVCPGVFVDKGTWTGVPLRDLLQKAGPKEGSARVVFTSLDGRYHEELPLTRALGDGVLISYQFNGTPFDRLNGFPLRLVARNEAGYKWVKWLGRIEVEK